MRKLGGLFGLALLLVALLALPAGAQNPAGAQDTETPKAEVFVGGAWIRSDGANFRGWNTSVAVNVNSWLGLAGDFSGNYYPPAKTSLLTFTFGPRMSYRQNKWVTPFAHAMVGGARASIFGFKDTTFAANVGGGLDIRATDWMAIRAIQADALILRFGGSTTVDPRLSFGVVFRFGKR